MLGIKAQRTKLAQHWLQASYQRDNWLSYFQPLSWLYAAIVTTRRHCYQAGLLKQTQFPVPVIVVGNVTLGGTGKTPIVIWLARYLKSKGFKPGIVSRGYGSQARLYPLRLTPNADPTYVGDEPYLIYQRTQCPTVVDPNRVQAVQTLLQNDPVDLIIADDGLQHYALGRTVEIAVIDGERRLGNGYCLPAGPLREPKSRLQQVDMVVCHGNEPELNEWQMQLQPQDLLQPIGDGEPTPLSRFVGKQVHAVAGIGNPDRFFKSLRQAGLEVIPHVFPDHHRYTENDLQFQEKLPMIMTEKDAVKCHHFQFRQAWYLPVDAVLPEAFGEHCLELIITRSHERG